MCNPLTEYVSEKAFIQKVVPTSTKNSNIQGHISVFDLVVTSGEL